MKIIFAAFAAFLMIIPANAELEIVLNEISPQPVEPGQDLMLSITLVNDYSDIESLTLKIVPDSPIKLKNDNDRIIDIGRIIKNGAVVRTYSLHIDPLAVSGTYNIDFKARWSSNDQMRETNKTIKFMVQGVPQLIISNITINPELISPQYKFNLTFSVSNEGTGTASQVVVTTVTSGLPFVPDGVDKKIIKKLNPGEISQLSYRIMVKDKAEISSYSIPIKMDYKDENERNISSQSLVGIKVLGTAKLTIANLKIDPQNPEKDDQITITMRIENSGNGEAKFVKLSLDAPFEGTKTAFLGKIKPNDDAPSVFTFYSTESGDIPYNAKIEFEDDFGTHTTTEALNIYIRNTAKNSFIIPIGVVALAIGARMLYLSYRKKTK